MGQVFGDTYRVVVCALGGSHKRPRGSIMRGVESAARVTFIGSGDAFGSGGRFQTCVLVEDGEWRCLIDCGATSLVGLKAAGVDPASIAAIIISHLHGDHFGGLPFLLLDAQFNSTRSQPLLLVGHSDLESRLRATMDLLFPGSQRALDIVDTRFVEIGPGIVTSIGEAASIEAFDVNHFCGSPPFAVRLSTPSGKVIAYSGDTEWTDTLLDAAHDADHFSGPGDGDRPDHGSPSLGERPGSGV